MQNKKHNILFCKSKNRAIRIIKSRIIILTFYMFRIFPINRRKIVVDCYRGMGYYGNPKYIIDFLIRTNTDCEIVWISDDDYFPLSMVKTVPHHTFKSVYHLCTAHIWIDNCRKDYWVRKRKKQFYIQTWHGGIGPKRVEKDAIGKVSEEYIKGAINDSEMIDLFISNSDFETNHIRESFWYSGEILEKGLPRNDMLLSKDSLKKTNYIRKSLGISQDTKTILYAPTFRQDFNVSRHQKDFSQLIKYLEKTNDFKWVVLLHLHPNLFQKADYLDYSERFINVNSFDIQELLLMSDILITDYSSIMFDFALTEKPVFLYIDDLNEYKSERNFKIDLFSLPFDYASTMDELITAFEQFDYQKYIGNLNMAFQSFGIKETGNSCEEIVKIIIDKITRRE